MVERVGRRAGPACVLSALAGVAAAALSAVPLPDRAPGTRLLLHFDETSGRTARDSSAYENEGRVNGDARWEPSGRFGGCVYLDGDWDVVRCGNDGSLLPLERITFEAWVKPETVSGTRQIISKDILGVPWYQYHLQIRDGVVTAGVTTTTGHIAVKADDPLKTGEWTHLAGAFDRAELRLFVNGHEQTEVARGGKQLADGDGQLNVGAWSNDYWYKGYVDDVRVSSCVRYAEKAAPADAPEETRRIVIRKTTAPPRIDGEVITGEWEGATRVTGFLTNTAAEPTSRPQPLVRLTFDDNAFYMGFVCPFSDLKRDALAGHGIGVTQDDAMELFLDPLRTRSNWYQFIVNANGGFFELRNGAKAWTCDWRYRARVKGNEWHGEIAIPFSGLDTASPYEAAEWGINVCRDYKGPTEWTSIAGVLGAFAQPGEFAVAVFKGGAQEVELGGDSMRLTYEVVGTGDKHIEAELDVSAVPPKQRAEVSAGAALLAPDGREMATGRFSAFTDAKGKARLAVTGVAPGEYALVATLFDGRGEAAGTRRTTFVKPDESGWTGNTIGREGTVPPPWTPLAVDGRAVSCWNRVYAFGDSPFPQDVRVEGEPILAAPIRLGGRAQGESIRWTDPTTAFEETAPDRCILKAGARSGRLRCQAKTTVEFDGMVRVDVELVPQEDTQVEKLFLDIPLRKSWATLRYIVRDMSDFYDPSICGAVPDTWHGPFTPHVWLGNERGGLAWFAETDRAWQLQEKDHAVSTAREDDAVRLRVNIVDHTVALTAPLSFTFGLQATPTKPVPWDWQKWRVSCWYEFEPNLLIEWAHPWVVRWFAFPEPAEREKTIHGTPDERIAQAREKGAAYVQYININKSSAGVPEFSYRKAEWWAGSGDMTCGDVAAFGHDLMAVCPRTNWSDFFVRSVKRFVDSHDVDGLYVDNAQVWPCNNPTHGCGGDDGADSTSICPIFSTRELQKRIYRYTKAKDPEFILVAHACAFYVPFLSFFDIYAGGERFMTLSRTHDANYMRALPLDVFRAEFIGRNWGNVPILLAELKKHTEDPKHTENMLGLARLHGTLLWPGMSGCNQKTMMDVWRAEREFGIGDATFRPYWEETEATSCGPAGVEVSLYVRPDRTLAYIVNLTAAAVTARVTLDLDKLGLPVETVAARDARTGERLHLDQGSLTLPVSAENFRLAVLEKK